MNLFYYNSRKYACLVASSILHSIIILILILCIDKVKNIIDPLKNTEDITKVPRYNPAKISFASNLSPAPKAVPIKPANIAPKPKIASPDSISTKLQNTTAKAISSVASKKAKKIIEKIKTIKVEDVPLKVEKTIPELQPLKEEVSEQNKIEKALLTPNNIAAVDTPVSKNKITGAQLVQAFRQAYRSEQEEYSNNVTNSEENVSSGNSTDYVEQRLKEWKYASYNTRVNEALTRAFSIHSAPLYFEESIYTQIIIDFILNKEGKIQEVNLIKPTGYKPLDDYIIEIIKKAHFAPIPNHLETNLYKFRHSPYVRIEKGSHTVVYNYSTK